MRYTPLIIVFIIFGCKKNDIVQSSNSEILSFSVDTLLFDTVFTTIGSTTRYLKVYNNSDENLNLDLIALNQGDNSSFKLNVDGEANNFLENVMIRAQDSIYIFAEVTIDPNGINSPLIEEDFIIFNYHNQFQQVNLVAWGRDAYFHSGIPDFQQNNSNNLDSMQFSDFFNNTNPEISDDYFYFYSVKENTIWTNDKPHVVYGDVIINNGVTLQIEQGCELYLHSNSWILVDSLSTFKSEGTLSSPVIIQSDRTDSHSIIDYSNNPGQWGKIWMLPGSRENYINYTILKNGKIGLHVDGQNNISNLPIEPILTIKNSIIFNMSEFGILAQGSKIRGENLLITNCGISLLNLNIGGDYDFKHCTFANFWPYTFRQTPSIYVNNYYEDNNGYYQERDIVNANFNNSIITGSLENEIFLDKSENNNTLFNFNINYCYIKTSEEYWSNWDNNTFYGNIVDGEVSFRDYELFDFMLDEGSVAIDVGNESVASDVPLDINGVNRVSNPDLGCFESN